MEQSFAELIVNIFEFLIIGGIALTIFIIVFHGVNLINSRGDPSAFSQSKEKIKKTLIGLGVLLISYVLLTTINPEIINVNFNVGDVDITTGIDSSSPEAPEIETFEFQEIPVGKITEGLLAGVSSKSMPCYEYVKDGDPNIIGNTIDQNGDGEINEKDVLLNKDIFYCVKLLTDAYKAKVEHHLYSLIEELNTAMNKCQCKRTYTGRYGGERWIDVEDGQGYDFMMVTCTACDETSCWSWEEPCDKPSYYYYCDRCCGNTEGCGDAPETKGGNKITETIGSFTQYDYDPCPNRLEVQCKSQEIDWLISGTKPNELCFSEEYIKYPTPEPPILLTLNKAIIRMEYFRDYYKKHFEDLNFATTYMKGPWGERFTLSEFDKIQNETKIYKKEKTPFIYSFEEGYDISRYCKNFHLSEDSVIDDHPCKKLEEPAGERAYYYDGDSATFYFSQSYNEKKENLLSFQLKQQSKCTVIEGDMNKGLYSGVIPIGETVDEAKDWGKEAKRIMSLIVKKAEEIRDQASAIVPLELSCTSERCKSGNTWETSITPVCGEACNYVTNSCHECIPKNTCYGVCPKEDFYALVNKVYWWKEEDLDRDDDVNLENCFEATLDGDERLKREENMGKMGELQKFYAYSDLFLSLADMTIDAYSYSKRSNEDLSGLISGISCKGPGLGGGNFESCDPELSIEIKKRFDILEKLSYSRKKFTGCVKGYSIGYKDNPTETIEVFSCTEGVSNEEDDILILPTFPYPNKAGEDPPYNNCYPQNSDRLTEEQRKQCFYNPLREGTESNPGCLLITFDYMDNYYCCN